MSLALLPREHAPKDELQRGLDAIEGYVFFRMIAEAMKERFALGDRYSDDPRMQDASAAVLTAEQWICMACEILGFPYEMA